MSATALQRCPRCGNENSGDSFACSFCGKRLRIEKIEKIPFFKRIEEDWFNPYPWYIKILYLIINPSRAFWDINHLRKKSPGLLILLLSSLFYGFIGLIIFSRFNITSGGIPVDLVFTSVYSLGFLLAFFLFGFFYQLLLFYFLIWIYTKGANYSVGFTQKLEKRFGLGKQKKEPFEHAKLSPFSIYKGGTLLQKQEAFKSKMMLCAFTPFMIINLVKLIVVAIGFSTSGVINLGTTDLDNFFRNMMENPLWAVLDVLDAITLAVWVPILITISIRELSNSSTYRVLITSYIISIIVSIFIFFLRPTLFG
ncbi:MAG: zinc ribbon domain-containing protein [Candidatus Lokiarchaeota archaeon]|nr:zinc ribbon domain-containing protein [Candidatus Lokiarchaeota archaeon]